MSGSAPGAPVIEFRPATGALVPLIETFYLYRWDAPVIEGVERVDMGQIRFMLKGKGEMRFANGHADASLPVMVTGPGIAAATYRVAGPFHCFGASLRAIGWKSLIGLPADTVTNRVLDGREVLGPEVVPLLDRLRGIKTIDEMVAAVEPLLLGKVKPVPHSHMALARVVREWAASSNPSIQKLYDMVPMSQRQVMRLCNEYYGGSPVHLKRKFRALRAAMRIYKGEDPAQVAEPFSDQSHMINEIRHFTGHTPRMLRYGIDPVLAATLENETFHFLPEVLPEAVDPDDD